MLSDLVKISGQDRTVLQQIQRTEKAGIPREGTGKTVTGIINLQALLDKQRPRPTGQIFRFAPPSVMVVLEFALNAI